MNSISYVNAYATDSVNAEKSRWVMIDTVVLILRNSINHLQDICFVPDRCYCPIDAPRRDISVNAAQYHVREGSEVQVILP